MIVVEVKMTRPEPDARLFLSRDRGEGVGEEFTKLFEASLYTPYHPFDA